MLPNETTGGVKHESKKLGEVYFAVDFGVCYCIGYYLW